MKTRKLRDLKVSSIGLECMGFSPDNWEKNVKLADYVNEMLI